MGRPNSYIADYIPRDYGNVAPLDACVLDCSLGVNPYPYDLSHIAINPNMAHSYPHDEHLHRALIDGILERFGDCHLCASNICLGNGSSRLLYSINSLYGGRSKTIMGHAPQFMAYVDNVHYTGATYVAYNLDKNQNYKFDAHNFITEMKANMPALVCIENPNNPTGQQIPLEALREIIKAAGNIKAAIVIDEAYGDYLDESQSAINLVSFAEDNDIHMFVTRSFSKGFGLAGIRLGYAIGTKDSIRHLNKLIDGFDILDMSKVFALDMLAHKDEFLLATRTTTRANNIKLQDFVSKSKLWKLSETSLDTPISVLYVPDENIDLDELLRQHGILSVSGRHFDNLGKNAVRIMLPYDTDRLIQILCDIQSHL